MAINFLLPVCLASLIFCSYLPSVVRAAELKAQLVNKIWEGEGLVLRETGQVQLTFPDGRIRLLPYRSCLPPRVVGGKIYIFTTREEELTGIVVYDTSRNQGESYPVPADLKRESHSPCFSPDGTKVAYYFVSFPDAVFIDRTGKIVKEPPVRTPIIPRPGPADEFEALIPAKINGKYGFLDGKRKMAFPCKFDYVYAFSEGLALVKVDERYGFIDKTGKTVIAPQYVEAGSFNEGLAHVRVDDKWGFINRSGKMVIPPKYESAGNFSEGLARVTLHEKNGFIDQAGAMVIKPKYEWAQDFYQGVSRVTVGGIGYCCDGGVRVRSWPSWKLLWQSPLSSLRGTDMPPEPPIWETKFLVEFDPRFFDPPRFLSFQVPEGEKRVQK
jgi:hypothetical protein